MKFKSLYLFNFMRYKGENRLDFSCEKNRPVTVVLGDNTSGKTTLSQAFRFALYGRIQVEQGKREKDYCLLNNDVIAGMDANAQAKVEVRLEFIQGETIYRIARSILYRRKYPDITVAELGRKQKLEIMENDVPIQSFSEKEADIQAKIEELLPYYLSSYFLFDGEKWSDPVSNGLKKDIKESVHKFTGLNSLKNAMYHLKEMGPNSTIKYFENKISGGGIYDNIRAQKNIEESRLRKKQEELENAKIREGNAQKKWEEAEHFLEENRTTEETQKRYRLLVANERDSKERAVSDYQSLISRFSEQGMYLAAEPLMHKCLEMMKSANMQRRDIPHMRQGTIDYIVKSGRCICGTSLREDSTAYHTIMEYRNYLPPADIGSLLGEFERTANRWKKVAEAASENIKESAKNTVKSQKKYIENQNERIQLEQMMEATIDFKEKREELKQYQAEKRNAALDIGRIESEIRQISERIQRLEADMQQVEAKNQANALCRARADIARELYEEISQSYQKKEQQIFSEINAGIQENFRKIFQAQDKKVVLDSDYNIKMMYAQENGYREEKNLSEGEKIARNFAFIISIMEYSQKQKQLGDEDAEVLPMVLDGPFSKLGKENIGKVSAVLPQIAEQVILFMLEKDWEYTDMDAYVGARYQIEKGAKSINATIRRAAYDQ